MRTAITKHISKPIEFKSQLLHWTNQFREVVFLDSNEYQQAYSSYDCIVAVDAFTSITTDYQNAFEDLYQYQSHTKDWLFGYLSYDLKNDTEDLQSHNFDGLDFPDLFFFQPKKIFFLKGNELSIHYLNLCDDEVEEDFETISTSNILASLSNAVKPIIQQRVSKESYLQKIQKMLDYIHLGSIYEANFCMEFYAEKAPIDPIIVYEKLNAISEPPFATFFKNKDQYLLSASPERYLKKVGEKVISQPIKGTARRSFDVEQDAFLKKELMNSEKERSENIMIVDLVRNDLSHTATKGSVVVEELCKVYTFKQVHQMISTIISKVEHSVSPVEIIKTTFPMGSMTGAPKISAMKIIEELEVTKRGLYSGAVGYFTPTGDFDFNVVIRSILYDAKKQYLSFSVGSAITAQSIPENEYEECLLKAKAMFEVLQSN
ncbi:anthranilate synthase component I family protein [Flavobacterium sp. NRK F7]|uniref:anthranilate synthase component I family protein n=1 Tax=Flavobacterium sp. NRK F7 TaxID=2954930 RepID=UPI002090D3A7|nr:chorismate-binding protein [Flavobacterium sp. NRK F7]MCO6163829.1 anthranilate synthase component I family protein [Flavobacterium sp. NRK F7]